MPSPFTDCQALVGSCLWSFISGSRRNRLLSSKFGDWRDLPALFWAPMAGCNGRGERDGGTGHGKTHSRTGPSASWGAVALTPRREQESWSPRRLENVSGWLGGAT